MIKMINIAGCYMWKLYKENKTQKSSLQGKTFFSVSLILYLWDDGCSLSL